MNRPLLKHSESLETATARHRRRVVGLVFLLPFLVSFFYGVWYETVQPWCDPMDWDGQLMPLSPLWERCAKAFFSAEMLFTLPMLFSGLALYLSRVSIKNMLFCAMSLTLFGVMLVGMFLVVAFAKNSPVPESLEGLTGIVLCALIPTTVLSLLLLTLGREVYVRLCAFLPPVILWGILLLVAVAE